MSQSVVSSASFMVALIRKGGAHGCDKVWAACKVASDDAKTTAVQGGLSYRWCVIDGNDGRGWCTVDFYRAFGVAVKCFFVLCDIKYPITYL